MSQCNTTLNLHSTLEGVPLTRVIQGGGRLCSMLMTCATTKIKSWGSYERSDTTSSLRITSRPPALTRTSRTSKTKRRPKSSETSLNCWTTIRTSSKRRATPTHLLNQSNSLKGHRDSTRNWNKKISCNKRGLLKSDWQSIHCYES